MKRFGPSRLPPAGPSPSGFPPAGGVAATASCLLAFACGGGASDAGPTDPGPPAAEIEVEIGGPAWIGLPASGGVSATYESLTEGPVSRTTWSVRRENYDGEEGAWTSLGTGERIQHTFTEMGTYVLRAVAEGEGRTGTDLDTTAVLPHFGDISRPIAFFSALEFSGGEAVTGIYLMDPSSPQAAELVARDDEAPGSFSTNALSWNPAADRLVLGLRPVGPLSDIFVLDPTTDDYFHVNEGDEWAPRGISWQPDWSPTGEWIAYVEDARIPSRAADELVLARADGSEVVYPAGEDPDEDFYGFYPSFSPDGGRVALGNARFGDGDGHLDRIGIYSDLWSGDPTRQRLHTEEQIREAYAGPLYGDEAELLRQGVNGTAWSPDGDLIAYAVTGVGIEAQRISIASADGSGDIRVLPYEQASSPAWSPDGRFLLFAILVGEFVPGETGFHIFLVDREGRRPVDLSRIRSTEGVDDFSPTW